MTAPTLARRLNWEDIDTAHIRTLIRLAHDEDLLGAGLAQRPATPADVTTATFPPAHAKGQAQLIAREPMTLCGLPLVPLALDHYDCGTVEPLLKDGDTVMPGTPIANLRGQPANLLTAERVLLNFLQHLSGIATHTAAYVQKLAGTSTRLLDTRKTTPGYRTLEKYAVACAGGWNHRIGLWDRVLIKDNHLAAFAAQQGESLRASVQLARTHNPSIAIEVEVDHPDQISPAIEAGADCILLDNFSPSQVHRAIQLIDGRCATEASGGITLDTIADYAQPGLDFISTGAPVHQSRWVDIGLDWQ